MHALPYTQSPNVLLNAERKRAKIADFGLYERRLRHLLGMRNGKLGTWPG